MARIFYYYPIVIGSIAIALHLCGTVGLFQTELPRGIHMLMYTADILVVIGLFAKSTWGYYLALVFFVGHSILQSYWGVEALSRGISYHLFLSCPLVITALALLVFQQDIFIARKKASIQQF